MTKEQAIRLLDQITAQVPLTRQQHEQVLQALKTLEEDAKPKR